MNLINALSLTRDTIYQNARVLLPIAVSTAVTAGLQDQRIGKIIGNVGLVGSGMGLIAASGIPNALKSWHWKSESLSPSSREAYGKSALRLGTAVLGVAVACYGIYMIAMSPLEFTTPGYNGTSVHYAYGDVPATSGSSLSVCEIQLAQAKEDLLSCPEAQQLWKEVEASGSFTIRCVPSDQAPMGALVQIESREILISETVQEMVVPMLFELNNLKRPEDASKIGRKICSFDVDGYANAMESFEYETAKAAYEVVKLCVNNGFLETNLNKYILALPDYEEHLEAMEKNGHADHYRLVWHKICNPLGLVETLNSLFNEISGKDELQSLSDKDEL